MAVIFGLVVVAAALKFLYFGVDDGTAVAGALARPLKMMVLAIYERTHWIPLIWEYAPIPRFSLPLSSGTILFFISYFGLFVGVAWARSGIALARRLRSIEMQHSDDHIRASMIRDVRRLPSEPPLSAGIEPVREPKTGGRWFELFVAPLIVAIVAAVVLKFLGLA